MNIVGFSGSPHKSGNTSWAVETILDAARQDGNQVAMFNYADINIEPCRACFNCKSGGGDCIIKDDMHSVYTELKDADALVFGSPIYMGQMTAQAKIFMDRLFPTSSPKFSPYYKEQGKKMKLILVFTQGNPDKSKFETYLDYTRHMFEILEYEVCDVIVIAGTRSISAEKMEGLEDDLRELGRGMK